MPSYQAERMQLIQRTMNIAPAYARAMKEENLEHILVIRQELAASLEQADKLIVNCIQSVLERRLAEDAETMTTQ